MPEQGPNDQALAAERERVFYAKLNTFTPDAQEFITDLSSQFMEPDVRKSYENDPQKIKDLALEFGRLGINKSSIGVVMDYFNLPYEIKK